MKKVRKALSNKNGFSYIPVCIFTLIVVMVIGILMQYAFIYHVAREQRDEVQLLLDSYVTKEAIEYYDAFKQGKPYRNILTRTSLLTVRIQKSDFHGKALPNTLRATVVMLCIDRQSLRFRETAWGLMSVIRSPSLLNFGGEGSQI